LFELQKESNDLTINIFHLSCIVNDYDGQEGLFKVSLVL